jgi:hypothetical protein
LESTPTPWGWLNTAEVAGPPSPLAPVGVAPFWSWPAESGGPLPAKVEMTPLASIFRIRSLRASAMKTSPPFPKPMARGL